MRSLPRLGVGQWLGLTIGVLLLFAVSGIGLALSANQKLSERRDIVLDQVEPAQLAALGLENALINEETGVRGYVLTREARFLEPYQHGLTAETQAYRQLAGYERVDERRQLADVGAVRADARAWQTRYVAPALKQVERSAVGPLPTSLQGKALFDAIRGSLDRLKANLAARLTSTQRQLRDTASLLKDVLLFAGALILGSVAGAGLLLRGIISRPLRVLGRETQRVTSEELGTQVVVAGGAREIVELGAEIEQMRQRIVRELRTVQAGRAELEAQASELARSNAELEQFAYVASHDLQEPLRKVASFCQALERRYHGQLDERADQYIEFAVDGAKRMQVLINDLLAFSRVGRSGRELEPVDLGEVVETVRATLSESLREAGASICIDDELPVVRGERALLVSLFQNLLVNAVKFRGSEPPVVHLSARREGREWQLECSDNGIGVEAEYAERIFVIFQRLHSKEAYPGTGIGLAMCRKIVEYHGGRMWLEPAAAGARFLFTLPIAEEA